MTDDVLPARRDLLLLLLAIGLIYLGLSWVRPLANPDEPRYVEIPREMVASGDWVVPRLNGVPYFYKPPLFFWAEASAYSIGGMNRFLLRFWPGFCGILGCLAVYLAGRQWFDRRTGLYAAAILSTSTIYFALSQLIILDMMLTFFMSGALLCCLSGLRLPKGKARRRAFWGYYFLTGLGVLTKGLIAILVPGAVIFLWFLLLNQWRQLRHIYLISGGLILLAVTLPWHFLIHQQNEHWFDFYIIHEHFERYLSDVSKRSQPFWFFLVILPLGMLPWFGFLPQMCRRVFGHGWRARTEHREVWFLGIWVLFFLFFFSISKSKLIPYILPAYPPLALLMARYWRNCDETTSGPSKAGLLTAGIALAIGGVALPIAGFLQEREGKLGGDATWLFYVGAFVFAAVGIVWIVRSRKADRLTITPLLYGFLPIAILFNPITALFQPPSSEQLVSELKPLLNDEDLVFCYKTYIHGLPLYLEKAVGVVDTTPNEQSFGLEWEDHSDRYQRLRQARRSWREPDNQRVIFVMTARAEARFREEIRSPYFEVVRNDHFVAFANQPLSSKPQQPKKEPTQTR